MLTLVPVFNQKNFYANIPPLRPAGTSLISKIVTRLCDNQI